MHTCQLPRCAWGAVPFKAMGVKPSACMGAPGAPNLVYHFTGTTTVTVACKDPCTLLRSA